MPLLKAKCRQVGPCPARNGDSPAKSSLVALTSAESRPLGRRMYVAGLCVPLESLSGITTCCPLSLPRRTRGPRTGHTPDGVLAPSPTIRFSTVLISRSELCTCMYAHVGHGHIVGVQGSIKQAARGRPCFLPARPSLAGAECNTPWLISTYVSPADSYPYLR